MNAISTGTTGGRAAARSHRGHIRNGRRGLWYDLSPRRCERYEPSRDNYQGLIDHGGGGLVLWPLPALAPRNAQLPTEVGLPAPAAALIGGAFRGALLPTPIMSARHSALTRPISSTAMYTFL